MNPYYYVLYCTVLYCTALSCSVRWTYLHQLCSTSSVSIFKKVKYSSGPDGRHLIHRATNRAWSSFFEANSEHGARIASTCPILHLPSPCVALLNPFEDREGNQGEHGRSIECLLGLGHLASCSLNALSKNSTHQRRSDEWRYRAHRIGSALQRTNFIRAHLSLKAQILERRSQNKGTRRTSGCTSG